MRAASVQSGRAPGTAHVRSDRAGQRRHVLLIGRRGDWRRPDSVAIVPIAGRERSVVILLPKGCAGGGPRWTARKHSSRAPPLPHQPWIGEPVDTVRARGWPAGGRVRPGIAACAGNGPLRPCASRGLRAARGVRCSPRPLRPACGTGGRKL